MTEPRSGGALPPPGWYPDAGGPGFARWWDGGTWTEHVQALGPAHSEPVVHDMSRTVTPVTIGAPGPISVGMDPVDIVTRLQAAGDAAPVSPVDFVTGSHPTSSTGDSGPAGSGGELVLSRRQRRELEQSAGATLTATAPRPSVVPPSPAPSFPPPGFASVSAPAVSTPVVSTPVASTPVVSAPALAAAAPAGTISTHAHVGSAPVDAVTAPASIEGLAPAHRERGARATARLAETQSTPVVAPIIAAAVAAQPPVIVTTPASPTPATTGATQIAGDPADAAPFAFPGDYPMSASVLQMPMSTPVPLEPAAAATTPVAAEFHALDPAGTAVAAQAAIIAPAAARAVDIEPAPSPLAGLTGPQRIPASAAAAATAGPSVASPAPAPVSVAATADAADVDFDALLAMAPPPEAGTAAAPVSTRPQAAAATRMSPPFAHPDSPAELSGARTSPPSAQNFAQPRTDGDPESADFGPMARTWPGSVAAPPRRKLHWSTGASWMLALLPLVGALVIALVNLPSIVASVAVLEPLVPVVGSFDAVGAMIPAALAPLLPAIGGAIAWLVGVLLASIDRARLRSFGHEKRPSIVWALLLGPLGYLVARAVVLKRTTGHGVAPVWVAIPVAIVSAGAVAAAALLVPTVATSAQLRSIEQLVSADLAAQQLPATVVCPEGVLIGPGLSFTCEAHDELGGAGLVTVTVTGPGTVEWDARFPQEASAG